MHNQHVSTVILGASKESQLKENLNALITYKKYSKEINDSIEKILDNKPQLPTF
jgi:aryl-alcohol dehydrogenase-like predicted oxidoreductase